MSNMRNEIKNSNIKFHSNKINDLIDMVISTKSDDISLLPVNDRALIYTMYWCTSEHCNLSKYEFDRLLEMSRKMRNYLNE